MPSEFTFVQEHCGSILQELEKKRDLGIAQKQKGLPINKLKTDIVACFGDHPM